MRVTEQIDALESLGRSPASHLVIPRVLAGLIMIPALTVLANLSGILSGWISVKAVLPVTDADFIYGAQYYWRPWDAWYSVIKAFFFAGSITIISCYMGFNTQQGAEGVGKSTTTAVVTSSVLILVLDTVLTRAACSTNDRAPRRGQAVRQAGGAERGRLRGARGRDGRAARPVGHRQERAAQAHHRPDQARPGHDHRGRQGREPAQAEGAERAPLGDRLRVPERRAVRLDERVRERPARHHRPGQVRRREYVPRARRRVHPAGEPAARHDRQVPGAALGRDAQAGRDRAGDRGQSQVPALRRAHVGARSRSTRTSSTAWCSGSTTSWASPASW